MKGVTCVMGRLESKGREKGTETISEAITTENFPRLMSNSKPQAQEAQRTPKRINARQTKTAPRHFIYKLSPCMLSNPIHWYKIEATTIRENVCLTHSRKMHRDSNNQESPLGKRSPPSNGQSTEHTCNPKLALSPWRSCANDGLLFSLFLLGARY